MPEHYSLIGNKFYGEGFGQEHFFSRRGDSFQSQAKFCVLLKYERLLQIVEKNVQKTPKQMLSLSKILTIPLGTIR